MRLILELHDEPQARAMMVEMLEDWRGEHSRYGWRRILVGLSWESCGYSVPVAVPGVNPWSVPVEGHRWLSVGGDDHRIAVQCGTVVVAYSGRRHEMRGMFREFLEQYWEPIRGFYQTREPGWMPWETADRREV